MKRCRKTHKVNARIILLDYTRTSYLLVHKDSDMFSEGTHVSDDPAGPDAVIVSHPTLIIRVLPPGQDVLVAQVVGPLEQNPGPALHTNRVAPVDVDVEFGTVTTALIIATLKVFIFIKHDLEENNEHSVAMLHYYIAYYSIA